MFGLSVRMNIGRNDGSLRSRKLSWARMRTSGRVSPRGQYFTFNQYGSYLVEFKILDFSGILLVARLSLHSLRTINEYLL